MRTFGFFRQSWGAGPDALEVVGDGPPRPDAEQVGAYLDAGCVILVSPEPTFDPLVSTIVSGEREVRTDGAWAWPGDLATLVRERSVALPDEFVEHMASNGWACPELSDEETNAAVDAFMASGLLELVEEVFEGDPFAADPSSEGGPVPADVAALARGVLPMSSPLDLYDYALAGGLDPDALFAGDAVTPDGGVAPEVLAKIGERLGWHDADPEVETTVEAVLRSFHSVLLGRHTAVDPAALARLRGWASDRADFWRWLGGSVSNADDGLVLLYSPETLELLQAVVESAGDPAAVERRLGPLRMAGLRSTAALVEALESNPEAGS